MPASASDAPINFKNPRRETSIQPLGRTLGKLAVHHFLEFGASRQLLKAAPILRPLGFRDAGADRLQIELVLLAGTNCLEVLACRFVLPSSLLDFKLLLILIRFILPMTRRATGNIRHSAQMVFLSQISAQRTLIGVSLSIHSDRLAARRLLITHVENLVARTQILFRRAMAVEAPLHLQRSVVDTSAACDLPARGKYCSPRLC